MKVETILNSIIERNATEIELSIASALWDEERMHTSLLRHLSPLPFANDSSYPVTPYFTTEISDNEFIYGAVNELSEQDLIANILAADGTMPNLRLSISDFSCALSKSFKKQNNYQFISGLRIFQIYPNEAAGWKEDLLVLFNSINNLKLIYSAEHGALLESLMLAYVNSLGLNWKDEETLIPHVKKSEYIAICPESSSAQLVKEATQLNFSIKEVGEFSNNGLIQGKNAHLPINLIFESAPSISVPYIAPARPNKLSVPQVSLDENDLINSLKIILSEKEILAQCKLDEFIKFSRIDEDGTDLVLAASACPWLIRTDPLECGKRTVISALNLLSSKGATPLGIVVVAKYDTYEMDPGLAYLSAAIKGIGEACEKTNLKVIAVNSTYSLSRVSSTPFIFIIGTKQNLISNVPTFFKEAGQTIIRLGATKGELGHSLFAKRIWDQSGGEIPDINFEEEENTAEIIRTGIMMGWIKSCRPISRGGQLTTIAIECALSGIGANLDIAIDPARAFGENPGRYIVTANAKDAELLLRRAPESGIAATAIGETGGDLLKVGDSNISVQTIKEILF